MRLELIDDPIKYRGFMHAASRQSVLMVSCLCHTYRSFRGFICYLFVRSSDGIFIIDALNLRAYLRGDRTVDGEDLRFSSLLSEHQKVKLISGGASCLRMLWQEYGEIRRYTCVKASDHDLS